MAAPLRKNVSGIENQAAPIAPIPSGSLQISLNRAIFYIENKKAWNGLSIRYMPDLWCSNIWTRQSEARDIEQDK